MDGHSSGTLVTERLARPTRAAARKPALPVARRAAPIWSCSRWGLPCRFRCRSRGGLLPHRFTLALPANRLGGLFSVALSLGSPPPAVNRHRVSVEPGLSSPRGCPRSAAIQPSDPRRLARALLPAGQAALPAAPASRDRPCRRPWPGGSGAGTP